MAAFAQQSTIQTTVSLVVAPTTVTDRQGRYVNGLTDGDFVLYDNNQPQRIRVDTLTTPISLVVAVQSNAVSAAAVAKIHKIGSMIEPMLIGERGECAVLTFDERIKMVQRFTSDPDAIAAALRKVRPRADESTMVDAVVAAVRLLAERPPPRRRVILLIGESKDRSSETKLENAVSLAQHENVSIYPVTYSAFLTSFTASPSELRLGGDAGVNLLAIFTEIGRLGKANAADVFANYTGGRRHSFTKQRGLEQAIAAIGEELHSQYFLSFTPAAAERPEFHQIRVEIRGRAELVARTRPGYWPL